MTRKAGLLAFVMAVACVAPQSGGMNHYANQEISFEYPAAWRQNAAFATAPRSQQWYVWLSTERLEPCDPVSTGIDCSPPPVAIHMKPDGVFVGWSANGWIDWGFESGVAEPVRVGGAAGTLETSAGQPWCIAIGGQTQIRVKAPSSQDNWLQLDGCIAGPFDGVVKAQMMAMLASVVVP